MYRRFKKSAIFKEPLTKHGGGKIERRARVALYIGIGTGLAAAVFAVMYMASLPALFADLLPTLLQATILPLIIVTFYLIGLLDADEDIYREVEADVKSRIKAAEIPRNKEGSNADKRE